MLMRFVILHFSALLLSAAAAVNVYSSRKDVLDRSATEQFEKQTGIEVNLLQGRQCLMSRIQPRGSVTFDVLVTVDAGNLHRAKAGILRKNLSKFESAFPAS